MERIDELKTEFLNLVKESRSLYESFIGKILQRDVDALALKIGLTRQADGSYVLQDAVFLRPQPNGCIEIEDRRGSAFLWIFEVQLDCKELRVGSIFTHDGRIYSVEELNQRSFDGVCETVEELIQQTKNSISLLRSAANLDTWGYNYYEARNDITRSSLENVIATVLKRKP